jgi:hypothetical protein
MEYGIRRNKVMRKRVSSVAMLFTLLVGGVHPAAASTPVRATGTFTNLSDTLTPLGTAGDDTYYDEVLPLSYKGDLTGIAIDTDILVMHKDGSLHAQGTETCASCTIGGKTGAFVATWWLAGTTTAYAGTLLVTRATGGLAGLHAGGAFKGTATGQTYAYTYWFGRKGGHSG